MTRMNDMAEATRLTREGRLDEAMAVLRGERLSPSPSPSSPSADLNPSGATVIDLVPPRAGTGGAWGLPGTGQPSATAGLDALLRGALGGRAAAAAPLPEGARFDHGTVATEAGRRDYRLYVPASGAGPRPLLVMLHGCTQSPEDFAAGTRMNEVAEEMGFLVAYPGQNQAANAQRCWNWFQPGDQARGRGEPALIAAVVAQVRATHDVDPARVFVAGLSAGGAQAAIMGAAYPDVFAGVGVHSGLACGAARDVGSAFSAMRSGGAPRKGTAIPTIVFHGDRDATVAAVNGDEVLAQAGAGTLSGETVKGRSSGGASYSLTRHRDASGRVTHEQWLLHGAGHAWAGGSGAGSYTDPAGPDASREMARFFLAL